MKKQGQLLTLQAAAHYLGIAKREVGEMVGEGLLRQVKVGSKCYITAQSIERVLGYDPTGVVPAQGRGGKYSKLSFEDYAVKLLNRGVKRAHSRTLNNYRQGVSVLAKQLGARKIADITETDLRLALRKIAGQYAKSSLQMVYRSAKMVVSAACAAGDIPSDPSRYWEIERSGKPVKNESSKVYSEEDIAVILRASREYDTELYAMFSVLACTGMRPGELLGLEWSAFDPKAQTIRVYQAVTRAYERVTELHRAPKSRSVVSVPKSEYSTRTLHLSVQAADALLLWRKALKADKNRSRAKSRFIFPGRCGKPRSLSGCEAKVQKFRKACSLEDRHITLYKFRHTVCTRLVLDQQPIAVIQRIMGDNSPDVIARVYTHVGQEDALRATAGLFAKLPLLTACETAAR